MHGIVPSDSSNGDRPSRQPGAPLRRISRILVLAIALVGLLAVLPGGAAAQGPTCVEVSYEQDDGIYLVETASQLQCIGSSDTDAGLDDDYRLTSDIDLADPANADPVGDWNGGEGFASIGTAADPFTGSFDGNGHTITGLHIKRPIDSGIGLFGSIGDSGWVTDLTLTDASLEGDKRVGVLAGGSAGTIVNVEVRDSEVIAASPTGGLLGALQETGVVEGSTVSGSTVSGTQFTGGLVGTAWADTEITRSTVESSDVESIEDTVGGLVGMASSATITESAVIGTSVGTEDSFKNGGFVGQPNHADLRIARSYVKDVTVVGSRHVGGFIGRNNAGVTTDSYVVDGDVTASSQTGGFVGGNFQDGETERVYIANSDIEQTRDQDAVNYGFGSLSSCCGGVTDSYTSSGNTFVDEGEDVEITDDIEEEGVTVLSPDQMTGDAAADNMDALDFSSPCGEWVTTSGDSPKLRWQENPDNDCEYDIEAGAGTPTEDAGTEEPETATATEGVTTTAPDTGTPDGGSSPDETTVTTSTGDDAESPATATTGAGGPGFGVAVALVALLAAALLAVRRRE